MTHCHIIIIGFRCADDIVDCVSALSGIRDTNHSVHICENGGPTSYDELVAGLLRLGAEESLSATTSVPTLVGTRCIRLTEGGSRVFAHQATGNIGYAGGINAVLDFLAPDPDWSAIWILNPDTAPAPMALAALRDRAVEGSYGVVGSRLVLTHNNRIQMYGGRWRRWLARGFNIGLGQAADAQPDVRRVEAEIEYVCGASMYVVRPFITTIGKMNEDYFLYSEEVDWCFRRGDFKLGYAHESVVRHAHGATIGSSHDRKARSSFSVFLDERSKLLITRRFYPAIFPIVAVSTLLLTAQYVKHGAWKNFGVALAGWFSGLKGETGYPKRFAPRNRTLDA